MTTSEAVTVRSSFYSRMRKLLTEYDRDVVGFVVGDGTSKAAADKATRNMDEAIDVAGLAVAACRIATTNAGIRAALARENPGFLHALDNVVQRANSEGTA